MRRQQADARSMLKFSRVLAISEECGVSGVDHSASENQASSQQLRGR